VKIIWIARELGIEPATPDEARVILGPKRLDKVAFLSAIFDRFLGESDQLG
jgi:hypothetical protein